MTEHETPLEDRNQDSQAGRATGWHTVNIGHLVMGTAFLGLFVVWALVDMDAVDVGETHWLLPLPWLVAGVVGLAATVIRNLRGRTGKMSGWN